MFLDVECGCGGRLFVWLFVWFWFFNFMCCVGFSVWLDEVMSDSRCWLLWLLGGCRIEGWRGCFKDCFLCFRVERWVLLWCWRMWFWLLNSGCCFILLGFLFDWIMVGVGFVLIKLFFGVWKFLFDYFVFVIYKIKWWLVFWILFKKV